MKKIFIAIIIIYMSSVTVSHSISLSHCIEDNYIALIPGINVPENYYNNCFSEGGGGSYGSNLSENETKPNENKNEQNLMKVISNNEELMNAYKDLAKERIVDEQNRIIDLRGIVKRHNWYSAFIFWTVHILLFLSIVAATYEFIKSRVLAQFTPEDTELNVEIQKIALKTSLQGVVLLGFSLAFYFLYVKFIHPVTLV